MLSKAGISSPREFVYRTDDTIGQIIWQEDSWDGLDGLGSVERRTFFYDEYGFLVEIVTEQAYGDELGSNLEMKLPKEGQNRRADIELHGDAWTETFAYSGGSTSKRVVNEKVDGYGENKGEAYSKVSCCENRARCAQSNSCVFITTF